MDVTAPQIAIEAIAVELSDSTDLDIGLRLGNPSPDSFDSFDTGAGRVTFNTIGKLPRNFEASLKALELKGKARVRARPQMVVVNGAERESFHRFAAVYFDTVQPIGSNSEPHPAG